VYECFCLHVCVLCVCLCTCACVRACVGICVHVCVRACVCVRALACVFMGMLACMCKLVCIDSACLFIYLSAYLLIHDISDSKHMHALEVQHICNACNTFVTR